MSTPMTSHAPAGWLAAIKHFFCRVFSRPENRGACDRIVPEEARPITSDEIVDESSEDSFPASDPPSYTGTTSFT
ncbi:hypothetical protein [Planctomyces sp. SH-PL62]|uniref:hypothetical protein n=1 Tax=Planctomyces sp. SH-PL62 TaxID=1636152 RepID=UPI00078C029E|nr:hypothetical protein [Planctomyces sp. SH-PL62]AMV40872.1 hypothetical protein VT85_25790 [Planctomyces sp. SH-PL62]